MNQKSWTVNAAAVHSCHNFWDFPRIHLADPPPPSKFLQNYLGTLSKKIRDNLGIFHKQWPPLPPPPFGNTFGFPQKPKILPFLHLLLGIGDPSPSPTSQIPKTPFFPPEMNEIK